MSQRNDNWIRKFLITDTINLKKGYTVYKITSNVFPRSSPEALTTVTVWKRFNDFKKLHHDLKSKHKSLRLKDKFPELNKASTYFKRFESGVIEERKRSILVFLDYVATSPLLFTCQSFVKFFESGYTVPDHDGNIAAIRESLSLPPESDLISIQSNSDSETDSISTAASTSTTSLSEKILINEKTITRHTLKPDVINNGIENYSVNNIQQNHKDFHNTDRALQEIFNNDISSNINKNKTITSKEDVENKVRENLTLSISDNIENTSDVVDGILTPPETPISGDFEIISPTEAKVNYIFEAAYYFSRATQCEASLQYEAAFDGYKKGIEKLLHGVQEDNDKDRRQIVKDKTHKYLSHAEKIYSVYLESSHRNAELSTSFVANTSAMPALKSCGLERPLEELRNYKLLGILDSVMLVTNLKEKQCYVIKAIHKISNANHVTQNIFPKNVPYMVPIIHYFQSENAIYLLLKQASGGKLWDHIKTFQSSREPSRQNSINMEEIFTEPSLDLSNVVPKLADVIEEADAGYMELVQDYATKLEKQNSVDNSIRKSSLEIYIEPDNSERNDLETSELNYDSDNAYKLDSGRLILNNISPLDDSEPLTESDEVVNIDMMEKISTELDKNIPTTDLLENAQQLLKSVSATLINCDDVGYKNIELKIDVLNNELKKNNSIDIVKVSDEIQSNKAKQNESSSTSNESQLENTMLQNAERAKNISQLNVQLPERLVQQWGAELLLAIEGLHQWGVLCRDLHRDNLLVGDHGQLWLSYQCSTGPKQSFILDENMITAPEVTPVGEYAESCDWWGYGVLLYELITGHTLKESHPNGITEYTTIEISDSVSSEARSILTGLLAFDPDERLGCGIMGVNEIKTHRFFKRIDWDSITGTFFSTNK